MMKTVLFLLLVCLPVASLAQVAQEPPKTLPAFTFYAAETGATFTEKNLARSKPVIVLFFDPTCDHCQLQAEWVNAAAVQFSGVQFVWITTAEKDAAIAFKKQYLSSAGANHHVVLDKDYKVDDYFGYTTVPSIYIYDRNGQHQQTYRNEVAPSEWLPYLK